MKNVYFVFAFFILFSSCLQRGPNFQFKKEAKIKQLGVKYIYSDTLYDVLKEDFDFKLDSYISKYNENNHEYNLYKTENGDSNAVTIHIKSIKLATKKEQALASIGSLAGIALPSIFLLSIGSNLIGGIWFYPSNKVKMEFTLSPDLAALNSKRIQNSIFTRRTTYYGGQKEHIAKICKHNFAQISFILGSIEKQYIYQRKYYDKLK
jgi:hypothetical protein